MPVAPEQLSGLFIRDDDEGLFSRDINGQLVRLDAPTESDYGKTVTVQIDGQPVVVPLAEPLKDAGGNIVQDLEGRTTPRYTTIYDAAVKLYVKQPGDEEKIPIPTLCHQPHMTPVAVCRLCVVQVYGQKRGQRAAERKLLPACQHPVKEGMEVFTMNDPGPDGQRVRSAVKVMTELLAADHLRPAPQEELARELAPFNELGRMADRCGAQISRFQLDALSLPKPAPAPLIGRRPLDETSPVFVVDHDACILCERCVRACDEVMENQVIGRTGKGANAGVSFDLNDAMGESGCVQCGECMVSCPTTAITFKPVAQVKRAATERAEVLSAAELTRDPVFSGIPPKFLLWQKGLVVRRRTKTGEFLCHQGDAGNTAFIIKSGRLEVSVHAAPPAAAGGLFTGLRRAVRGKPAFRIELTPANLIVGEMACLSGTPRSADVRAMDDGEVWEVRRNVLDRMMRLPSQRARFEHEYRERALDLVLQNAELFRGLDDGVFREIADYLRERLTFVSVNPGQTVFRQGDRVTDLYIVRLGYVRVGVRRFDGEARVISRGPGTILGEIGLLALSPDDARKPVDEVDDAVKWALASGGDEAAETIPAGVRSATCTALGHLELARLRREDFLRMIARFPMLRRRLVEQSLARLRSDSESNPVMREYVEQGLYEGRNILLLDLDLCTRCDECTRGCVEQHGRASHGVPMTRMLRDGLRFDRFLVATACRSCSDPHCMFGCPVDSIHRGRHLQIVIEDHCIGCGLCAANCPYGNIFIEPNLHRPTEVGASRKLKPAQLKAVTCDLCDSEGTRQVPEPRCVAACPHDAAFRTSGDRLLAAVLEGGSARPKR